MLTPVARLSRFNLASFVFPMTFECLPKVIIFAKGVLGLNYVITRRNPIPDFLILRIGVIIGSA